MKAVFMGDFQVYARPNAFGSGTDILDNSLAQLEKVFEVAKAEGATQIFHAGDFFEHPNPSPTVLNRVIATLQKFDRKYPDMILYSITGNHDFASGIPFAEKDRDNRTILQALEKATTNFVVVDYQHVELDLQTSVICLPFVRNENEWIEAFPQVTKSEYPHNILLMHQDTVQQIHGGQTQIDETEIRKHFDYVINGHIHRREENGNFITIGSLLEQKAGDATEVSKGVYVLDTFTLEMRFVEIGGYPKFVEYYADEEIKPEDVGNYILRRERPIETKKSLRKLDDTTPKGREDAGRIFLSEKMPEIPADLDTELAALTARVQAHTAKARKQIRYDRIMFEGFRSWMHGEYDLNPSKLTYIQAQTGAGKSTLFEALVWCEFGTLLKEKAKQEHITPEKWLQDLAGDFQGTMVQVTKTVNDTPYIITRCLGYKGDVFGQRGNDNFFIHRLAESGPIACTASDFGVNEEDFSNKTKKTQIWMDFCGIDLQTFLNVVIFTPEKCNLIQAGDADKRAILEPLLQVDWVDGLKDLAKAERETEQTETAKLDADIRVLSERQRFVNEAIAEIDAREQKFGETKQSEIEEIDGKIRQNESSIPDFEADIQAVEQSVDETAKQIDTTIPAQLAELNQELTEGQKGVFKLEQERAEIEQKAALLQPLPTERYTELQKEKEALQAKQIEVREKKVRIEGEIRIQQQIVNNLQQEPTERATHLKAELPTLEANVRAIGREHDAWVREIDTLNSNIAAKKTRLTSLQSESEHQTENCPVCAQKLPEGHNILASIEQHKANIKELESQIETLEKELADKSKLGAGIEDRKKIAEDAVSQNQADYIHESNISLFQFKDAKQGQETVLEAKKSELAKALTELQEVENSLQENLTAREEQTQVSQDNLKKEKSKILEELDRKEWQINDYTDTTLQPIRESIKVLEIKAQNQAEYVRKLETYKTELEAARDDLKVLLQTIDFQKQQREKIAAKEFDQTGRKDKQDQLEAVGRDIAAIGEKKARRDARIANLTHIEKVVCGAKGLKTFLIQQKLDQLNEYATAYANALGTSIRFSIDDKNSYCTTLMIEGRERDAAKASNGQLLIANLILAGSLYDLHPYQYPNTGFRIVIRNIHAFDNTICNCSVMEY